MSFSSLNVFSVEVNFKWLFYTSEVLDSRTSVDVIVIEPTTVEGGLFSQK